MKGLQIRAAYPERARVTRLHKVSFAGGRRTPGNRTIPELRLSRTSDFNGVHSCSGPPTRRIRFFRRRETTRGEIFYNGLNRATSASSSPLRAYDFGCWRRKLAKKIVILLLTVVIAGCATSSKLMRTRTASRAKTEMIGMSQQDVLACMGPPERSAAIGSQEVWSYTSGGDIETYSSVRTSRRDRSEASTVASTSRARYCKVDVIMNDGVVSSLNYRGRTGGLLTGGEQCAFAVSSCV